MSAAAPAGSPEARALLARVATTPHLLVALDFDGTLSHLSDEPMSVRALPEAAEAVRSLAAAPGTDVAFVSGRTLRDLRVIAEHDDDSPFHLAGSHGAEFWHPRGSSVRDDASVSPVDEDRPDVADEVLAAVEAAVEALDGAWIERKEFGFGLHTRLANAADTDRATSAVDTIVAERAPAWRRRTGRDILEFAWRHEGKDAAVAALREQLAATAVLFAGDDVTDEDALRSLRDNDLGIKVGAGETAAAVRVASPTELAQVLSQLARMRSAAQE
ncbi:trehalose-phosphatase [Microbacterium limosum]|uniref:Trehalose 6-phosphate phosphatase n=1 Tax=Microbacterium limosum TaxID=3079935 RepID=A0AAU0MDM9_9MICO|nr:trehalose-phosphatase [Microbacterium sp. Y20]WOQ68570.1 trehalose-phosphatase [Microbacterium sp. Y20]